MDTVSVVVCTYNGAQYLKEQLDSILRQTRRPDQVIIQDDASTDSTMEILEEYTNKYPFIQIYRNKENKGFRDNFFEAISNATCDYIALSDQDDVWTDNHIEVLLNLIGDNDVACGNSLFVDEHLHSLNVKMSDAQKIKQFPKRKEDRILPILYNNNFCQGTCLLARRTFLQSIFPIPDTMKYHDIWIALSACVNNGIEYTPEVINYYRQHSKSITPIYSKGIASIDFIHLRHKVYGIGCKDAAESLLVHYDITEHSYIHKILDDFSWYSKHCRDVLYRLPCAIIRFKKYRSVYMTNSLFLIVPRFIHWLLSFSR